MVELIKLPYLYDALTPVISDATMSFHYGKHLRAYVDNLNKLLPGSEFEKMVLEEIVCNAPAGPIFNNAGQILNHNLYFSQFQSASQIVPSNNVPFGSVAEMINKQWGSFEAFKRLFSDKGVRLFGSGWIWLSAQEDGSLVVTQEVGASNPVVHHLKPLLTFDVWEHAYYLDYQNRRSDYLDALWQIVDWRVVEKRYE